jgi:hypothetical protein
MKGDLKNRSNPWVACGELKKELNLLDDIRYTETSI